MISFRYFIVAIVAVFLALALGIVVGSTALNGPVTTDLRRQVTALKQDREQLAQQNKALNGEVNDANQFTSRYGAQLLANKLAGKNVLLVGMPGTATFVEDGMAAQVVAAGGKLAGRIDITSEYVAPNRSSDIVALATGTSRPIGVTLPPTNDPGKLGAALLAYALVDQPDSSSQTQVLAAFAALHMLSSTAPTHITRTSLIVVVTSGTFSHSDSRGSMEQDLVLGLEQAGGRVVVAGDAASATGAGLIARVRQQNGHSLSTVDDADTGMGQVSAVLATSDAAESQFGQYGSGKGSQSLFP
jgi:hypothetical protein